jgi:mono/diheme cytochrome c family protein
MSKLLILLLGVVLTVSAAAVAAQSGADERAIRAGKNIAVTTCVACHVVSPDQSIKPVLGPGIRSFETIANRPDSTVEVLRDAMKIARWRDPAMAATLLP